MTKSLALVLCGLLTSVGSTGAFEEPVKRSHYTDEVYGFSLEAPRFPEGLARVITPVKFFAPYDPGVTSNAQVMIQKVKTTRKAFLEQTIEQLKPLGLKINSHRDLTVSGREALEMEIQGTLGGLPKELRQIQLAAFDDDRVVLITCTATPDAYRDLEAEYHAFLSSLRLGAEAKKPPKVAAGRSTYVDETYGFRVEPPRFRIVGKTETCSPVTFAGPPVGVFASNVGVTVGPPKTRERVREESAADFKKPGFKLHHERDLKVEGREAVEFEFEAVGNGGSVFRMLTLTVLDKDRTYMVACIAPGESFAAHEAEFRACLESFKLPVPNP
jgi:hypothetical protein